MAEIIPSVIKTLMLLCVYSSSINGRESLILAELSNGIKYQCGKDLVCYHIWQLSTEETHDHIAILTNGEIETALTADSEDSQCTLKIKKFTLEDAGRHHCRQRPILFPSDNVLSNSPQLNLMPGNTVSLQCILLTYVQQGHCYTQLQQQVSLTWVDESGAVIQEDSQQHLNQKSACDVTLTVNYQSPIMHKYRCQATVEDQVLTSVEFSIGRPGKGRGRGRFIQEKEAQSQGGNQDIMALAVGLVGCAVLSAVAAGFVVNRRRKKRQQLQKESECPVSTSNVMDADDVIYADIMLPVASDFVLVHDNESTEYACVQYK
ncbi:uncharacterized protein LOC141802152 [Halichoeres trimaculatus]|uniref:uncharacterized protein LOC141802152 n=1 Tax=Halichoeres trimaculatus TaxID=147232 RepID=UPI003D9E80DA